MDAVQHSEFDNETKGRVEQSARPWSESDTEAHILDEIRSTMNRSAYWKGQTAASEKYCLTGFLLDMNYELETAKQERDERQTDTEIWYMNGWIDYIQEYQERKSRIQAEK